MKHEWHFQLLRHLEVLFWLGITEWHLAQGGHSSWPHDGSFAKADFVMEPLVPYNNGIIVGITLNKQ